MYKNCISRKNPRLLILLVDQCPTTKKLYREGKTIAQQIANDVNSLINELILMNEILMNENEEIINPTVYIAIIGYGYIPWNNSPKMLHDGWNDKIAKECEIKEVKADFDNEKGYFEYYKVIEPCTIGDSTLKYALVKVKSLIEAWKSSCDAEDSPIPLVINFSSGFIGASADIVEVTSLADDIKNLELFDGNPLMLMIHYNIKKDKIDFSDIASLRSDMICLAELVSIIPQKVLVDMSSAARNPFAAHIDNIPYFGQDTNILYFNEYSIALEFVKPLFYTE